MKNRGQILILAAFVGFIIVYHFFGYTGHFGYDDLHYARLANDFKNGIVDYNDHFTYRTPVIVFTSISYLLFGVSDFASSLPALIISVLVLLMVFTLLKERGNRTLIIGLALTTLSGWFLFYSDKLMPDMYVAFSVLCALYVIHQYRYANQKNRIFLFALLLNLALLFGFMSKGTIILILPLLIYYFIIDIVRKKHIRFWFHTAITGALLFLAYFFIIWLLTGDFFKRLEAVSTNAYLNLCSYDQQPVGILLKRIVYGFFEMIIYQGMATGFVFVIAYAVGKKSFRIFKMDDSFSFWTISSVILLLSSNFMSVSLKSYSPMCLDPRHYLYLIPVVSISASIIINEFIEEKNSKVPIVVLAGVIAIISVFLQGKSDYQLYIPLFILVFIFLVIQKTRLYENLFVIALLAILLIQPISAMNYAQKVQYRKQMKIFNEQILNRGDSIVVITNEVQKRLGDYYSGFTFNNILSYNEFIYDSLDHHKKILFKNWYTRYLSGMSDNDLPTYAKNISGKNKLLFQDSALLISVYEMTDFSIPEQTGKVLLDVVNDFESKSGYWPQNSEVLTNQIKYEGNYANEFNEFSSAFEYGVDSLDLYNIDQLFIRCNAMCNFPDKPDSRLVITIQNEDGAYIWDGLDIGKYIKAYGNWWPVKHEINVRTIDLKEHSVVKVYLWNVDKQKSYVDNFQIEIIGINRLQLNRP